jgi:peptide/nickel transport system substrate-binding protein
VYHHIHSTGGKMSRKKISRFLFVFLAAVLLLAACSPQPAVEAPATEEQPAAEDTAPAASSPTEAPTAAPTAEPTAEPVSLVGGTLVWVLSAEPITLDWHKADFMQEYTIDTYMSAALLALSPDMEIVPWLAESYTISDDGLVYDFTLRQDVKFSDGTPLTANEYAWSFNRSIDPETASPVAAANLGPISSVEAVDDYTLRLTLASPFAPLLFNLTDPGYMGPLSQAALESLGDDAFSRAPVGVGPYIMEEWVTGDHVTLVRDPDYNWGPAFNENTGPYNLQKIIFRFISEDATKLAGLEDGEISFGSVQAKDVQTYEDAGFTIFTQPFKGMNGDISMNVSKPPFDDLNVRQALNLAVDRQAIIDVTYLGAAEPAYGPLSSPQLGYWTGVEEIGYGYDPDRAQQLLEDSGYTLNADHKFEKDGATLAFTLQYFANPTLVSIAQILDQQLNDFGFDVTIEQVDPGTMWQNLGMGEFQAAVAGYTAPEADSILYPLFHTGGGLNWVTWVSDPDLDTLLDANRGETDPAARQEILNQVQKRIVEQAYIVPLTVPQSFYVLDPHFQHTTLHFYDVLNLADTIFVSGE